MRLPPQPERAFLRGERLGSVCPTPRKTGIKPPATPETAPEVPHLDGLQACIARPGPLPLQEGVTFLPDA